MRKTINKIVIPIIELFNPVVKKIKKGLEWLYWKEMDSWYRVMGLNGWMLFPPSFYHYHTEEEGTLIEEAAKERIQKMIDEL